MRAAFFQFFRHVFHLTGKNRQRTADSDIKRAFRSVCAETGSLPAREQQSRHFSLFQGFVPRTAIFFGLFFALADRKPRDRANITPSPRKVLRMRKIFQHGKIQFFHRGKQPRPSLFAEIVPIIQQAFLTVLFQ